MSRDQDLHDRLLALPKDARDSLFDLLQGQGDPMVGLPERWADAGHPQNATGAARSGDGP
jgi:hypothetical protein